MATDSTVAGFLTPSSEATNDNALEDILQAAVVGITGIPGTLVRPRWQPEPPTQPAFNVNWCAIGIPRALEDAFAYHATRENDQVVERDEILYVLHSFYGPGASQMCKRLRDGLEIAQNRATLRAAGLALVECQEAVTLPALVKETWVKRIDVTVVYRRRTSSAYPVRTIESGQLGLDNELWVTPITVNNPTP